MRVWIRKDPLAALGVDGHENNDGRVVLLVHRLMNRMLPS